MIIKDTRINEKGEEEIVISDFSNFKELVEEIDRIRIQHGITTKTPINIIIKRAIRISYDNISYPINFSNIIFEEDVSFIHIVFYKDVKIVNTIFKKITNFKNSKFYGINTSFINIKFRNITMFNNTTFINNISFSASIFEDIVYFINAKFISINSLTFNATFKKLTKFNYSIFNGQDISFNDATFHSSVDFTNCSYFSTISFEDTIFNKHVYFYYSNFKSPQQFLLTNFKDKVSFNNTIFEKEAQFLRCKVEPNSYISFQGTKFNKGIDISRSNFNFGKTSFWNINVKDEGLLGDTLSSEYYKNDFGDEEILPSVPKKLRESMRFIKNSFYSEGNRIEGSNFEKKELEVYREEIKGIPKQKIKKEKEETTNNLFLIWQYIKIIFSIYKDFSIMIYNYIKSFREKYSKIYIVFILLVMIILLLLFETYENHLWFWLFVPVFIIAMNLEVKRKNIKKAVKENNYIPLVLLYSFKIILLVLVYGLVPNEYNIVETIKSKITNISVLNEHNSPIAFGIVIIVALFLTIIFYENDRILLFFNKNSNDFGTNWMVGVNFTILSGLIISTFILFPLWLNDCIYFNPNTDGIGDFLQNLGEIMSITKWDKFHLLGEKPTSWQYIWLYLGRIFIAYGIYQTIQAFRKYGKS